jgi:2-polyprenyl-6-methoxyphenol hydroxylase-like FAD-dependent oxidoreductase
MKSDLVIIGAGPVGMATAIAAREVGIKVEVYDCDEREGTHSYALALHPSTLKQLSEWGLAGYLGPETRRIERMDFYGNSGKEMTLHFDQVPGFEDGLLVVGQDHLERVLLHGCEDRHVPVHWNHRLAQLALGEDEVQLEMESLTEAMAGYAMARMEWQVDKVKSIKAPFVVGADGYHSIVRRRLGIDFPETGPKSCFAVFEFQTDAALENAVAITLGDAGTSVLWPLPGGYCRWSFEIEEEAAKAITRDKDRLFAKVGSGGFPTLEVSVLESLLEARAPWFKGSIETFRWRMLVRFEQRLANSFGHGRCWLAGDAGHLAPPVGMQSMNIGMHEGVELATRASAILAGNAPLADLDAYGRDRRYEWQALLGMTRRFVPPEGSSTWLSEVAARLQGCIPASLSNLDAFASALGVEVEAH